MRGLLQGALASVRMMLAVLRDSRIATSPTMSQLIQNALCIPVAVPTIHLRPNAYLSGEANNAVSSSALVSQSQ